MNNIYLNKKQYLTINLNYGLCNRLKILLSYLYQLHNNKFGNKKLRIIWNINDDCPDIFNNLFEPFENVDMAYDNKNIYFIDLNLYTCNNINTDYISHNYYKLLKPLPHIQENIDNTKKLLQKSNPAYIACHIRRTDILKLYEILNITTYLSDQDYMHFINQYPSNVKVYIATDNYETQQKFINFYGNRLIYKKIESSSNLRQTSLQDAVVDMYICAGAKYFLGSISNFTDMINQLRN